MWSRLLLGAIGLAVLDAVVSSKQAAGNVGGALSGLGTVVRKIVSPTVPALTPTIASPSGTTPLASFVTPTPSSPIPVTI